MEELFFCPSCMAKPDVFLFSSGAYSFYQFGDDMLA